MSVILSLSSAAVTLATSLLSDLLGLATRPVVLLGQAGIAPETAASFAAGGILTGILGTVSVLLVGIGVVFLFVGDRVRPAVFVAAALYMVDGIAQLPQLVLPYGGAHILLASYPVTSTGATTILQLGA